MPSVESLLAEAYEHYRRGDLVKADMLGRRLLPQLQQNGALAGLLGMIALRTDRIDEAVSYLRIALRLEPTSLPLRTNLAFALANTGQLDEAREVASVSGVPELRRIVAFVDQRQGRFDDAMTGYKRVLAGFPQDYESWNNLGLLLTAAGEIGEAVKAFERALALSPDPTFYVNLSKILAKGERHPERQSLLRDAVRQNPNDPSLLIELGLAEGAMGDFAAAEVAYRNALSIDSRHAAGYLEYGMLLESLNRLDDMAVLVAEARAKGLNVAEIDFVEAWLLKRNGRFAEALLLAGAESEGINPSRHAQLLGEIADRLGDVDRAFGAFTQMNRLSAEGPGAAYARAQDFPAQISAGIDRLTPPNVEAWRPIEVMADPAAPIFILGFPRSGTTLLDTLLMNLPELHVLEELPIAERVEAMLGDPARIGSLSTEEANRLRCAYFDTLEKVRPLTGSAAAVVDKYPLHLVRAPLIHRLFPDARFVLVERHPCDVVLSCFMARFQTNRATVQFHDLVSTARTYHLAMEAWTRAAELLPIRTHRIRYERMVQDLPGEMRPLLAFLDLPWREEVLDNRSAAARRAHIATASYAQVAEPIYTRATGRWQRYRHHMEPVLPILAPWVERLGYTLDDPQP